MCIWDNQAAALGTVLWEKVRHDYGRKLGNYEDADETVQLTEAEVAKLPIVVIPESHGTFDDLPAHVRGLICIVDRGDANLYLVNTEGFDYARYVAILEVVKG